MTRPALNREDVESAFTELGRIALAESHVVDIAVYGGVAMMLSFPARPATRDVDAVALGDPTFLRDAVRQVATERGWPDDWLNDAVKGFLSVRQGEPDALVLFRSYPTEQSPGLRVFLARPEYLLAMKCVAMRLDAASRSPDVEDIKLLVQALGLSSAEQVLDIVSLYYPEKRVPPKTQFGVEEIMTRLAKPKDDDHEL